MISKKLKRCIGKEVQIILFNGDEIIGTLRKAKIPYYYAIDNIAIDNIRGTMFFKENQVKCIWRH